MPPVEEAGSGARAEAAGPGGAPSAGSGGALSADGFERLDRKLVLAGALIAGVFAVAGAIPTVISLSGEFSSIGLTVALVLGGALLIVLGSALLEYLRWQATRFRVTEERFERHFQLLVTKRSSIARDRIRTVDVTANPVHRLFGLAAVVIGTGQQGSPGEARVKLDAVSRERAEALRVELLRRAAVPHATPPPATAPIAVLDWKWAVYAPLSFLTPALGTAAVGAVFNFADWFGRPDELPLIEDLVRAAALYGIFAAAFGTLVVGAIGALVLFVEMWWAYRLEREPGGTLRVRRGLLTTRSISFEERRLRGVEVVEPLGVRLLRAARVDVVATGMVQPSGGQRTDHRTLLPAAPRAVADRVAAEVLREDVTPTSAVRLTGHPRAAFGRRLRWALAPVLVLVAGLSVLAAVVGSAGGEVVGGVLAALPIGVALVGLPLGALIARDAYRNLGHGLSGRYLLARRGALRRSTVALRRSGVVGWTVRQSVFQRRAGLVTVVATTAAGSGAYAVPDVDAGAGLVFADEAVPGLLGPFLE